MSFAVTTEAVDERGRAEHIRHAEAFDGGDELHGVGLRGPREVHLRQHLGHAERGTEQREERERGQINFTRLDAVEPTHLLDLRGENFVGVNDALRRARAAAGEKYGGSFVRCGNGKRERFVFRDPE